MLSFVFPSHFLHPETIAHLISFLSMDEDIVAPLIFSVLTFLGKYKSLGDLFPDLVSEMVPICKALVDRGTPKQAKQAIRCLYVNMTPKEEPVFQEMLEVSFN